MNLFQKPRSPYWHMRFTVNGKEHRGSTKRLLADKAGAYRHMVAEYDKHMNASQFGEVPDITIAAAMGRVLGTVEGKTKGSYDLSMRKFLGTDQFIHVWHLDGSMLLRHLNQSHLEDHLTARKAEGLKPASINLEVRFLRRVVNYNERSFQGPFKRLRFEQAKAKPKTRYLSDEEEAEIIALLREQNGSPAYDKAHDFLIFCLDTGLRLSDAMSIQWFDVDLIKHRIEVSTRKTGEEITVPISDRVMEMLKRRHNQSAPFPEMTRAIKLLREAISKVCNQDARLVEKKGRATIHSLRDTFATRLDRRGMTLKKISKLLGHTNTKMTEKYTQTEATEAADEARMLMSR
jgi:integrase